MGAIGAYIGYFTSGGAKGVGISTTKAVVAICSYHIYSKYFLSTIFMI